MLRIAILMGRSFTDERGMPEVVRLLGELGATARSLHLGDDLIDVARVRLDYDLYVLKNRKDLGMSVAAELHRAGAALLNPYPVAALLRDRIVTFRVLRAADAAEAKRIVLELLPAGAQVHHGASQTLDTIGIFARSTMPFWESVM